MTSAKPHDDPSRVEHSKDLNPPTRDINDVSTISGSSVSSLSSQSSRRRNESQENDHNLEKTTSAFSRITRIQSLTRRRAYEETFSHPLAHAPTGRDVVVDFQGAQDPYYPQNWPVRKKVLTTALYGFTTMGATFASSVYSPAVEVIAEEFEVGKVVSLLGLSFLLVGFGLGPLIFGPISEIYGRKPAVLTPYFVGAVFAFATGAAKDIQTVLITRFFTGLFASAPVTNTGGVLSDIWNPMERYVPSLLLLKSSSC